MMTMTDTKKLTTKPRQRRKRSCSKPLGARALLLTLALGGTLGGWTGLAVAAMNRESASPSIAGPAAQTVALKTGDAALTQTLQPPPIPTVQPPPANLVANAAVTRQAAPALVSLAPIPAVSQPVLRRPVARTRSSR